MALAAAKLNDPHAGPHTVGRRKCAYVKFTFASVSYATNGTPIPVGTLEDLFGIRFIGQMEIIRIQADNTAALEDPGGQWDATNQKLKLFSGGTASDPAEIVNATSISALEVDAVCWTQ